MGSLLVKSSNRYSVLQDVANNEDISWQEAANSARETTNQFPKTLKQRKKELAEAELPLRATPKSLKRSSQRVRKRFKNSPMERPLATLCSICESIFSLPRSEEWFDAWHNHHETQLALDQAVSTGCTICKIISKNARAQALDIDLKIPEHFSSGDGNYGLKFKVELSEELDYSFQVGHFLGGFHAAHLVLDWIMVKPEAYYGKSAPVSTLNLSSNFESMLPSTTLPPTTASDQAWDLSRYWLHTCRTKHKKCGHRHLNSELKPSRLVRVEGKTDGTIQARLDCKSTFGGWMTYLTLSHCWGDAKFLKLQTTNYDQFQRGIVFGDLSKVFQDALLTTLKLGFAYIWIDSLCIVQDSEEDWLLESSQMGEIYKHCSCNIAATGFSEGSHGFYVSRDIDAVVCQNVYANWKGDWPYKNEPRKGPYYLVDPDLWKTQVSGAPLNKRGWVLQERLLSPCVLHYGDQQLFWECFESYSCEAFPLGFPWGVFTPIGFKSLTFYENTANRDSSFHTSRYKQDFRANSLTSDDSDRSESHLYNSWHAIVEAYSVGQLTRTEDKLLAISGAAKQVRHVLRDKYLAGLWERNFSRDLLWVVSHDSKVELTPWTYRAPTWSWASLNAEIAYDYAHRYKRDEGKEMVHATLKTAQITYATHDDTGLVTGGRIHIQGPLLELRVATLSDFMWDMVYTVNGTEIDLVLCLDFGGTSANISHSELSLKRGKGDVFEVSISQRFSQHLLRSQPLYLLPIRTDMDHEDQVFTVGLVVIRTGNRRGEYMRIGVFVTEDETARRVVLTPASQPLPPELWEEDIGQGRYVVSMV